MLVFFFLLYIAKICMEKHSMLLDYPNERAIIFATYDEPLVLTTEEKEARSIEPQELSAIKATARNG